VTEDAVRTRRVGERGHGAERCQLERCSRARGDATLAGDGAWCVWRCWSALSASSQHSEHMMSTHARGCAEMRVDGLDAPRRDARIDGAWVERVLLCVCRALDSISGVRCMRVRAVMSAVCPDLGSRLGSAERLVPILLVGALWPPVGSKAVGTQSHSQAPHGARDISTGGGA
jgi:hypothetical protein